MPADHDRPAYVKARLDSLPMELRAARRIADRERDLRNELKALAKRIKQNPEFPRVKPSTAARRGHLYLVEDGNRTFISGDHAA